MIVATVDANIYISALQFGGLPLQCLEHARAGAFRLAASPPLIAEVRRVLHDKFAWSPDRITEALSDLDECTVQVHPTRILDVVAADPDDNRVLECAVESGSRFIVSGDSDLLRLGSYDGILILRVANFLKLLPVS